MEVGHSERSKTSTDAFFASMTMKGLNEKRCVSARKGEIDLKFKDQREGISRGIMAKSHFVNIFKFLNQGRASWAIELKINILNTSKSGSTSLTNSYF